MNIFLIILGIFFFVLGFNPKNILHIKRWKTEYKHYSFVDTERNEIFETWWSPEKGSVKLYIDGILQKK